MLFGKKEMTSTSLFGARKLRSSYVATVIFASGYLCRKKAISASRISSSQRLYAPESTMMRMFFGDFIEKIKKGCFENRESTEHGR